MDEYADVDARIQQFRISDNQRDELLARLLNRLRNVEQSHKHLANDLANEQNSRRYWQEKSDQIERQLTTTRQASEVNCFVQVIIDGDASYFHESFIQGGEQGGMRAAAELHTVVKKQLDELFPGSELPIMLHMFANLGGLSGFYTQCRVIDSPSKLFVFARGFNSSQDMFNLVDVGTGKEGADHKAREMLRIFMSNKQCKHIIFGGLHDKGYLNVLRPWAHDTEKRQRITLLETLPAQPEFKDLGYSLITAPQIFKSEQPKATITSTPTIDSSATSALPTRTVSPATSSVTTGGANGTWSKTAATNGSKEIINVASPKPKAVKYILQNAEGYRLDERLPLVPSSISESLKKKRESGGNLCNDYYLLGKCPHDYACNYNHDIKLSPAEINGLRLLARGIFCSDHSYCEDPNCYKGHVCVHALRGRCNKGDECYMYDTHDIDVKPAVKIYDDGRRETL